MYMEEGISVSNGSLHFIAQNQTLNLTTSIISLAGPLLLHHWGYTAPQWTQRDTVNIESKVCGITVSCILGGL